MIRLEYEAIDNYSEKKEFNTIEDARKYVDKMVGKYVEVSTTYAVSGDGVGQIRCDGCTLKDLFPNSPNFDIDDFIEEPYVNPYGSYETQCKLHALGLIDMDREY